MGITEALTAACCIVQSPKKTGPCRLARQGRLERRSTSSRLRDLLSESPGDCQLETIAKPGPWIGGALPPGGRREQGTRPESRAWSLPLADH